jgi:hypothetical protein
MAIDASIPLQITPVQSPDMIQAYGNALAMKSHIQQQQLQQQQMQENSLKLDQMQRAKSDDQVLRDSYLRNNGDLDAVVKDVAGKVSPERMQSIQQLNLTNQMDHAKLTTEQNAANAVSHDHMAAIVDSVINEPDPVKRQEKWSNGKALAVTNGWAKPDGSPDAAPDNDQLQFIKAGLLGYAASSKQAAEQATTRAALAQGDVHNLAIASQTVPDDPQAYQAWRDGLDPRTRATVPATYDPGAPARVRQMGLTAQEQLAAPGVQAKSDQEVRAGVAGQLATAPTYGEYQKRLGTQPHALAVQLPDFSGKDPATPISAEDQQAIRQPGLSTEQQTTAAQQAATLTQRTSYESRMAAAREQSNQIRQQIANRGLNVAFQNREADKMDAMQSQEQEQWQQVENIDKLRKLPAGTQFNNLKGQPQTMDNGPVARQLKMMSDGSRVKAEQLAQQQKGMRQRYSWGEFAPKGSTPAPTAQPATSNTPDTADSPKYSEAKIRQDAALRGFKADGPEADDAVKAARDKGLLQ